LELEKEIQIINTSKSQSFNIKVASQIFEEAINQICSSFPFIITLRTGGIVVQNLIIRLITNDGLKSCLKFFLDSLNLSEVAGCSVKKYANKVIETLLLIPEFCSKFLNYLLLCEKEKNDEDAIRNSNLYNMCLRFRGINILQLLFEKSSLKYRKLLYKDVKLIYKKFKSEISQNFRLVLKDTLLEVKNNILLDKDTFFIIKARDAQQIESNTIYSKNYNLMNSESFEKKSLICLNSKLNKKENNRVKLNSFEKFSESNSIKNSIEGSSSHTLEKTKTTKKSKITKEPTNKINKGLKKLSKKNSKKSNNIIDDNNLNNLLPSDNYSNNNNFQAYWHNSMYVNNQI
jgi:hypothetical protein